MSRPSPTSRVLSHALAPLALLALVLLPAGCGYTSKTVFPTDLRTVAVPIFQNRAFYRGVEFELTEALIKEIELRTPYKVTAEGAADTLIEGTITDVDQTRLSRERRSGLPQDMEVHVTIEFTWKDLRSGKVLRQRRGMLAVGRYIPTHPVGESYQVGQHEAVARLARDIVSAMASDW